MTENVIADFVADFIPDSTAYSDTVHGRVILSPHRLVLASSENRTTIPLTDMFDIAVGHVPPGVSEFFDSTVSIGYKTHGGQTTAVLEAKEAVIDKFVSVLFKAHLNGTTVYVKHPARIGGRVTQASTRHGTIKLYDDAVGVTDLESPFAIELSEVTSFNRSTRTFGGHQKPAVDVRHMNAGQAITTELTLESERKLNLLGRYLRLEYSDLLGSVRELELSDREIEALVALYSSDRIDDLAGLLDIDAEEAPDLLQSLAEKDLIDPDAGHSLTARGLLVVSDRIKSVPA